MVTARDQSTNQPVPQMRTIGYAVLTLEFHKEGHLWVGECRELGTATDGRSLERVEEELLKLVLLHVNSLEEIGEREHVFAERGITVYPHHAPAHVTTMIRVGDEHTLVTAKSIPVAAPSATLVAV